MFKLPDDFDLTGFYEKFYEKMVAEAFGVPKALIENPESSSRSSSLVLQSLRQAQARVYSIKDMADKYIVPEKKMREVRKALNLSGLKLVHIRNKQFEVHNRFGFAAWLYIAPKGVDDMFVIKGKRF